METRLIRSPLTLLARRSLLATCLVALVPGATPARAHAILVASTPAGGANIAVGEAEFTLRFNSRIDRARSVVRLVGPDRRESVLALSDTDSPDVLRGRLDLPPGRYILRWRVLAVDGHITRGDVPFAVVPRN